MEIIEFFNVENKEFWLTKIKESEWGAGEYLYELLSKNELKQLVGENTRVLMLVEGDELISFCKSAERN